MGADHRAQGGARCRRVMACRANRIAALLILAGCARPPASASATPRPLITPGPALGVVREGWHTGLIVPEAELTGTLKLLRAQLPPAPFVVIGWGQRRYYMARDPGLLTGLAALFPSASVLHVRAWRPRTDLRPSRHRTWLHLPAGGWSGLRTFLDRAFAQGPRGHLEALGAHDRRGLFFASTGTYDALHTCNTWTMQALRAAQLPAASTGVLFAGQVRHALRVNPLRRFRTAPPAPSKHGP